MDASDVPPLRMPAGLAPDNAATIDFLKTAAIVLASGAVGYAAYVLLIGDDGGASAVPAGTLDVLGGAIALVGTAVIIFLALAVHEAGHLLGGWLSGFRFQLLAVGPFMVTRTNTGYQVELHTHWSLYGGMAGSVPTDLQDLARGEARMVAGGPAASLLLGLLAIGAYIALGLYDAVPSGTLPIGWMAADGTLIFGTVSLSIGVVTLVPVTTSGFFTDGSRLLRIWRNHPAAARDAAVFALTALLFEKRPCTWEPALVDQATAVDDETPYDVEGRRLAYLHALDTGDMTRAHRLLQEALDRHALYPPALLPSLALEAAFFEGAVRQDAGAAARWRAVGTGRTPFDDESLRLRAQVAVQWATGEPTADTISRAREALAGDPVRGLAAAATQWLNALCRPSSARCTKAHRSV
ncbi:zinc metalloprotease [Salisaeta longa]|uniref:hypothetical protein n=1 Tax=Salisaeta longa TaxID=503170 RepID=UPI0003B56035|nr:hypothetical protein [Salisaeta longa]